MKSYNRMKSMLAVIASIAITTLMMLGCTTTADYTLGDDKFEGALNEEFKQKLEGEGIMDSSMKILEDPTYENLYRFVIDYADGIVVASENADPTLVEYARQSGKPMMEFEKKEEAEMFDNYNRFYEELQ